MIKNEALLIFCIFIVLLLMTMQLDSKDEIGLMAPQTTPTIISGSDEKSIFFFKPDDVILSTDIGYLDRKGKAHYPESNIPFTFLIVMGLFGFAFWGRLHIKI
jgi:hypothetical protein